MKLLRTHVRVNPRDSVGQGMDAVFVMLIFLGAGFLVDRALGTMPWMMILAAVLGGVGIFYKLKIAYEAKMSDLESEALARRTATRNESPSAP